MKKMTQIHTAAIILGCYFAIAHALVFDKCTRHDQCPQNSKCRPTGCDGYTCRCDPNYVHSHNRASCLPARKIGYSCNAKTSKCLSNFAICVDNVCRCNDLMEPTPEGRCKDPEFSVLEESCLTKPCSGGTVCEGDTCVCPQDMRRLTDEEFWIDAMNTDYCIDKDFSVDFCNGTRLPIPMLTTPPPSVNQPGGSLSDTTPSFPRSFTKIVSLVEQDADIYDLCSRHEQCPAHAQCRPEGCKGFSCLCDKGYMATTDRKSCVKAVKVNEACDTNTSCISPFALCDGVCRCLDIFVPTKDGRCKLPDISFVGEECSLDKCEYPATCVDGICRCVGEYREITSEEFWVDPTNIWQCAKDNTSLATCNGLNVTLPTAMTPPLPKINKETTPSNIISTTTRGKETTPFNILSTTPIADITTKIIDELSSQSTKTTTATNRQKTTLNVLDNGEHASESTTSSSSIVSTKPLNVESSTKSTTMQAKVSEKLQTTTLTSVSGTKTTVDKNEKSAATTTTTTAEMSTKTTTKITTTTSENLQTASITTPTEKTVTDDPISDSSTTITISHTSTFPTDDNSVILTKIKLTPTVNTNVGPSVGDFSTTQRSESMQVTSDITTTTTVNKENNVESSVSPSADSSHATKKESSLDSNRNVINRSDSNLEASPSSEFPTEALSSTRSGTDIGLDENKMTSTKKTATTTTKTTQMVTSFTTSETGKVVAQSTTTTSSVHPSSESANPDDRNLSRDSQTGSTTTRQPTTSTQSLSTDDRNLSRDSQTSSPTNQPKTSTNFPFGPTINSYLCESLAFHCSEILCIPSNWVCNGEKDCPDGRDEDRSICNKDRVCPPDEYRCSNFRCIPGSWLCDTQEDCPNKEDESKAAGCFVPDLDPDTETVTFETMISSMFNSSTMILFKAINDIRVHIPNALVPPVSPNTTATSVNTTAHVPEVPELKEKEPAEKSYTGTAGLGSLESIAIAAAAGLVFLINVIGIILALTRRNRRRKLDKKPPSTMNTSMASSDDTESGNFKIPRPNVLYPPYYVKEDWNTWNSTHFTQYAEQMYAMDEHSDFYPGSLKTL
eukprot:XP_019919483.1 PREDICTED: uncharacterized protein LOC105319910 isoform X1 [Crassostrea gigas]